MKTSMIKSTNKKRGLIKGEYRRFIHGHNYGHFPVREYNGKWYKQHSYNGKKNVREHRMLAEIALGRPLDSKHPVHHFDGGFFGGQLVICEDNEYHHLITMRQRAYEITGDVHKRKCIYCKQWRDIGEMKELRYHYSYEGNVVHIKFYCKHHHK